MRLTTTLNIPAKLNPALDRPAQRSVFGFIRAIVVLFQSLFGGAGLARRQTDSGRSTATLEYGTDPAVGRVTVAIPVVGATITLNGTAITAAQHRAFCTVTVATISANDFLTVNGVVITGKATPAGNYQFDSDGTDATVAAAIVSCINNLSTLSSDAAAAGIYGKIRAVRKAADGVVDIYAITEGTVGNAYTITTSTGVRLAITNDSSGLFSLGAAATNNQWDHVGGNTDTARSIVNNLALSSSAILNKHVTAACRQAVVTCATVVSGSFVTIDSVALRSIKDLTDSGGARITTFPDDVFSIGTTDTTCAVALVNCINNHPKLRERFFASNSSGVVTIQERPPESTSPPPISTSDAVTLAVTVAVNGLFVDSTIVLFQSTRPGHGGNGVTIATSSGTTLAIAGAATRLAGGASTTLTL